MYPPQLLSAFTTAIEKQSLEHSGRTVHCPGFELYINTSVSVIQKYAISPMTATDSP